jgi:hypothetical protein
MVDILIPRQPNDCANEQTDTAHPDAETAASENPWAAPRAHYAQVKRLLSWRSCVFQRGASLIQPQEEATQGQSGSSC